MLESRFRQGEILIYPYLWRRQATRGEASGRKDRPVCVALPLRREGATHLFLLAIASTPPAADRVSIEIPDTEKRRAGLKGWMRGWVVIDECNYDVAERSFHLDSSAPPIGRFSEAFTDRIKDALRTRIVPGGLHRVDRTAD